MSYKKLLIACFMVMSFWNWKLDVPFPENTGAPGELTCGRAPCHNINPNVGDSKLSIDVGTDSLYVENQTYDIKVKIDTGLSNRFGFQLLALDENNINVGTWDIQGINQVKQINGIGIPSRKYLTHTQQGNQQKEWQMKWKAPNQNKGIITFYASCIAANNDGTNQGDNLYLTSKYIRYPTTNSVEEQELDKISTLVLASEIIIVNKSCQDVDIELFNLSGKSLFVSKLNSQDDVTIEKNKFQSGLYIIKIKGNEKMISKKFFL